MADAVTVDGTTVSRIYADAPPAIGPSIQVTVPASLKVLVSVTSGVTSTTGSTSCYMSFAASGANTVPLADDARAMILLGNNLQQASAAFVVTFANSGLTTLTAKYKAFPVGSCTFTNRSIFGIPLP